MDSQSDEDEGVDVPDSSDSEIEDKATDELSNKITTHNLPNKGIVTMAAQTRIQTNFQTNIQNYQKATIQKRTPNP